MWTGGVRVIVPNGNGEILMVKQHHESRDLWMLPGGGVEEGESTLEAAKREVLEETGIEIEIERLVWFMEEAEERGQRFVNFFLAEKTEGIPVLGMDPEFDENNQILRDVKFVKIEDVKNLDNLYPKFLKQDLEAIIIENKIGNLKFNPYKKREKHENT